MKLKTTLAMGAAALFAVIPAIAHEGHKHSTPNPSATPVGGQKYTCTMHPEVVRDKPGKCPKCGMKLVPKKEEKPKQ